MVMQKGKCKELQNLYCIVEENPTVPYRKDGRLEYQVTIRIPFVVREQALDLIERLTTEDWEVVKKGVHTK